MNIELPEPRFESNELTETAISVRRSLREFAAEPVALEQISTLLWSAQGLSPDTKMRNAPSAGLQYQSQVYLAVANASELSSGIYRYDVNRHALIHISDRNVLDELEAAAMGDQPWVSDASFVVLIASDINHLNQHFKLQKPVGKRGERYAYIEAGAVLQNMALAGTGIGIGGVIVGGYDDEKVSALFELDANTVPLALYCAGRVPGQN